MKISLNWLKNYINVDLPINELSEVLTTIGLEVEGVDMVEMIEGGLKGVVVGEVKTCEKHPNADKLSTTTVDIGADELLHVVCGAPNVGPGQKVLIATVGTMMYNGDEPWKIKKGKIRGEVSEGMICAEDELGLGESHDGIMVLPADTPVGLAAAEYFNIESDTVFEIGLTPNRSDATSHLGVAKDLFAYLKINYPFEEYLKEPDVSSFEISNITDQIDVVVRNTTACPRYSGLTLTNVKVGPSPEWMQKHLKAIGVRPISNIVDITNYVLHELGQPLHAFDAEKIDGQKVIVTTLKAGTKFKTLDEQERTLHEDDLMICDGKENPMCIAGVFGGLSSGVTDTTTKIFLESAHFEAGNTRRTSTRHLLRTDAAKVFEKGSDPNITIFALKRAASLMMKYAGATVNSEIVDVYPKEIKPTEIHLKYEKVNQVIGIDISKEEVHNILRAMEMEINPVSEDGIKVQVPTNKADVTRDVDLIEEILRIYGFNKIPLSNKISSNLNFSAYPDRKDIKENIANHLASNGFNEMMGLSLIESKYYQEVLPMPEEKLVFVNNTSNIHLDIMRPEMMISGLQSVLNNHNRQQSSLKLFEFGKSYEKTEEDFKETEFLTIFMTGKQDVESWRNDSKADVDFYDLKREVNRAFAKIGITGYQVSEAENEKFAFGLRYHRGPSDMATFGLVDPKLTRKMGLKTEVYYAEILVKPLVKAAKKAAVSTSEISKFPAMRRDLALVVDQGVKFSELAAIAKKADKTILKEINLFDVYSNEEQLGKGKKSYAISYVFEDVSKTLKDKEVDKIMTKMMGAYEQKVGATIRK